jgi:hypothetical protein
MEKKSDFGFLEITNDYILIEDIGGRYDMSVTNDAENVVQNLYDNHRLENRRLFYKDSSGDTDELVHNNGKFVRFSFGHEGVEFLDE